jgi:chemotaxis protein methyltransferase CheR
MTARKSAQTLGDFAAFLASRMGLHFPKARLFELEQKMASLAEEAGYPDLGKYLLFLMSAPLTRDQLDMLARTLTIGETYFLRDPRSYQVLEEQLLPGLIAERRSAGKTLRIWSAGCSTGEEAYSLAILLSRTIPDIASWKIALLASDINPQALERGRRGVYGQWSFRNAPPWLMDYFSKRPQGDFEIIPRIRSMVRFSQLNLAEDCWPTPGDATEGADLIFCRNVMLYFDQAQIESTMRKFHAALKQGGWLFVGPTEVPHSNLDGFSRLNYGGAFVLCKGEAGRQASFQVSAAAWPTLPQADQHQAAAAKQAAPPPAVLAPAPVVPPVAAVAPLNRSLAEETSAGGKQSPGALCYAQALDLYRSGSYQEAAARVLNCCDAGQGELGAEALALAARAQANTGRFAEARACCEQAIARNRLSADNHYLLSIILEQLQDTAGAIKSLKHALYIDHDYVLAYFALGNLNRRCGDHKESQRYFANALRLLEKRHPHEVLEEAEGMTAGGLAQMIRELEAG